MRTPQTSTRIARFEDCALHRCVQHLEPRLEDRRTQAATLHRRERSHRREEPVVARPGSGTGRIDLTDQPDSITEGDLGGPGSLACVDAGVAERPGREPHRDRVAGVGHPHLTDAERSGVHARAIELGQAFAPIGDRERPLLQHVLDVRLDQDLDDHIEIALGGPTNVG